MDGFPLDIPALKKHIAGVLYEHAGKITDTGNTASTGIPASSVLVPLLTTPGGDNLKLILNKRSQMVRQPGDLCFPGGGSELPLDAMIAETLLLPASPLYRWPFWRKWRHKSGPEADELAIWLATGLRESLEEMNLLPFWLHFLGPLPAQQLVMFDRKIQPMVVWVEPEQRFKTNWEVQRIITIPFRELLDSNNYCTYHITYSPEVAARLRQPSQEFPAFRLEDNDGVEILWGVTFRIVRSLMKLVFNYTMPAPESRPIVQGTLGLEYYTGTHKS